MLSSSLFLASPSLSHFLLLSVLPFFIVPFLPLPPPPPPPPPLSLFLYYIFKTCFFCYLLLRVIYLLLPHLILLLLHFTVFPYSPLYSTPHFPPPPPLLVPYPLNLPTYHPSLLSSLLPYPSPFLPYSCTSSSTLHSPLTSSYSTLKEEVSKLNMLTVDGDQLSSYSPFISLFPYLILPSLILPSCALPSLARSSLILPSLPLPSLTFPSLTFPSLTLPFHTLLSLTLLPFFTSK